MTPHARLLKEICDYLDSIGAWYVRTNSHGYGRRGIPDVIACVRGRFVAIEAKAGRDTVSAWQAREMGKIKEAHGDAIVARKLKDVSDLIEPTTAHRLER